MADIGSFLLAIYPIFLVGIIVGVVQFLNIDEVPKNIPILEIVRIFLKTTVTSGLLAVCCYLILDSLNISYNTRIGVSIFVAFAGFEKLQQIFDKFVSVFATKIK